MAPITTAADNSLEIFSTFFRDDKIDISCESSARLRILMKHQALFASKDNSKKIILLGVSKVNDTKLDLNADLHVISSLNFVNDIP